MENLPVLKRLDVKTPLGVVHLVCFDKTGVNHRSVIFEILSQVSGRIVTADDLVQTEEHPKPTFPSLGFDVNWTHSGSVCVLAYGDAGKAQEGYACLKVGVDYEIHKSKRLKIADHFFNPEEVAHIKNLEPDAAEREFFRLWCRKEALFKCVGGSFFEGSLRRSVLGESLVMEQGNVVYFCDVALPRDDEANSAGGPEASLCVAVSRT